jgi:hypothetical protein
MQPFDLLERFLDCNWISRKPNLKACIQGKSSYIVRSAGAGVQGREISGCPKSGAHLDLDTIKAIKRQKDHQSGITSHYPNYLDKGLISCNSRGLWISPKLTWTSAMAFYVVQNDRVSEFIGLLAPAWQKIQLSVYPTN